MFFWKIIRSIKTDPTHAYGKQKYITTMQRTSALLKCTLVNDNATNCMLGTKKLSQNVLTGYIFIISDVSLFIYQLQSTLFTFRYSTGTGSE